MFHYFEAITNTSGDSLPGYFVRLTDAATNVTIPIYSDDSGTPIAVVSGVANMAKTDDFGNVSLFVVSGTYNLTVFGPDASTLLYSVRSLPMNSTQGDPGPVGPTGPANATYPTLTALKAGDVGNQSAILATTGAVYTFRSGNYTGQNDDVKVIKADSTALTTGAWVLQPASALTFVQQGTGAIALTVEQKLRQVVFIEDYGAVGDGATNTADAIENAITACPSGGVVRAAGGTYLVERQINTTRSGITVDFSGAKLLAKASTSFEFVWRWLTPDNVIVRNMYVDVNGPNRITGQAIRYVGLAFQTADRFTIENCTVENTRGFGGIPAAAIGLAEINNGKVVNCITRNCGVDLFASDGIYVSGNNIQIINPTCIAVHDTGAVLENCNNSIIKGGVAIMCSAGAAISNVTVDDKYGNAIDGMMIQDWYSSNTGGVQILVGGSGELYDTRVNVTLTAPTPGRGVGPALAMRETSTGTINGVSIKAQIDTATLQGILCRGDNVEISNTSIRNTSGSCIAVERGNALVQGCTLMGGTFGIAPGGTAVVTSVGNVISGQTSWCEYAFATSTIISVMDELSGGGVGLASKDGGATLNRIGRAADSLAVNGTAVVGPRKTGWAADTGTAKRSANATYTGTAAATYNQTDLQNLMNAVRDVTQTQKALKDDMISHGLIGT